MEKRKYPIKLVISENVDSVKCSKTDLSKVDLDEWFVEK